MKMSINYVMNTINKIIANKISIHEFNLIDTASDENYAQNDTYVLEYLFADDDIDNSLIESESFFSDIKLEILKKIDCEVMIYDTYDIYIFVKKNNLFI